MMSNRESATSVENNISGTPSHRRSPKNDVVDCKMLGFVRKCSSFSPWEFGILFSASLFLAISIILTSERFEHVAASHCRDNISISNLVANITTDYLDNMDKQCAAEFTFRLLIIIHCLFSLFYVWHGLFWGRWYELYVFAWNTVLRSLYSGADFYILMQETHPANVVHHHIFKIKIARLVFLGMTVITALIGCLVAHYNIKKGRIILGQTTDKIGSATEPLLAAADNDQASVSERHDREQEQGEQHDGEQGQGEIHDGKRGQESEETQKIMDDCKLILLTRSLRTFSVQFQVSFLVLILFHAEEFHLATLEKVTVAFRAFFILIWVCAVTTSLKRQDKYLAGVASGSVMAEVFYISYQFYDSIMTLKSDALKNDTGYLTKIAFRNGRAWNELVYPDSNPKDTDKTKSLALDDSHGASSAAVSNAPLPVNTNHETLLNYGATTIPYSRINE
ncbi:uncharacterized protein LOC129602090 isoform X2 [Paramacrobiotus metropolitanus]|uniref:uncharacterized protein LOC129602090 isoform X2 n=1 Tax=Paramacrobiotus metropolitanus TaxID=2943436 RepID=UPI0024460FDF|nr:uncharacterized protein LOC129602090 isoform X2 [Paramacrobiotus metropolitanus]